MPIYEYRCKKCGEQVEKRQAVTEDPLTVCEKCGGELEKMISLSGFQFKGAGWYVTDYSGKASAAKKDDASEGAKKGGDGESTSGTTSASKVSDAKTSDASGSTAKASPSGSSGSSSKE